MSSLFEKVNECGQSEALTIGSTPNISEGSELSLDDFYERLRQSHESDDLETSLPEDVQSPNLRPILREYQVL